MKFELFRPTPLLLNAFIEYVNLKLRVTKFMRQNRKVSGVGNSDRLANPLRSYNDDILNPLHVLNCDQILIQFNPLKERLPHKYAETISNQSSDSILSECWQFNENIWQVHDLAFKGLFEQGLKFCTNPFPRIATRK